MLPDRIIIGVLSTKRYYFKRNLFNTCEICIYTHINLLDKMFEKRSDKEYQWKVE